MAGGDADSLREGRAAVQRLRIDGLLPGGGTTVADPAGSVEPSAAATLATIARYAVDLFGWPLATRIRVCAAGDCGLLFVDASRPGKRRWCSMEVCGNRAKVREHRSPG